MKEISILLFAGALTLCTARPTPAVMTEYTTTNRVVAVTNTTPTSEVRPLAAYIIFPFVATGSVTISRVTHGVAVPLARHDFSGVTALTWFPPADFPFRRGEAFAVSSTVARFTLQLETSSDGHAVERTAAPEWFDQGRPYIIQSAGGVSDSGGYDGDTNALAILSPQIAAETTARIGTGAALSNAATVEATARIGADRSLSNSLALKLASTDADARFAMLTDQRSSSVLWFFTHGQQVGMDMIGVHQAGLFMFGNEYEENSLEMKATGGLDHLHLRHIGVPGGVLSEADVWDDGNAPEKMLTAGWVAVPATPTGAGTQGQRAYDSNYEYLCVAPNTWKRSPLATWTP